MILIELITSETKKQLPR